MNRNKKIRYKIRTRKLLVFLGAIIVAVFWLSITGLLEGQALGSPKQYASVTVEKGDTLWGIAQKYGPAGQDIRKTIYEIKIQNKIKGDLIPGDVLLIPGTK